jgi:LmbE family N-acetylglucosaminyl deacetylase
MKVLIVAAHPDDEVLGCGGTIALRAAAGDEVHLAILGEGVTSRYLRREEADPAALTQLHSRSHRVAELLGTAGLSLFKLPDNRFDSLPLLEVVKVVEGLVDTIRPAAIYTHHPGDLNIDHLVTFRAVMTATRPVAGCPVREIYSFEVPSSTEWAFQQMEPRFRPNVFVDVTATIATKIEAMSLYESECRPFPHPRSPEALRAIARRWGSVAGLEYAEALELVRSLRP